MNQLRHDHRSANRKTRRSGSEAVVFKRNSWTIGCICSPETPGSSSVMLAQTSAASAKRWRAIGCNRNATISFFAISRELSAGWELFPDSRYAVTTPPQSGRWTSSRIVSRVNPLVLLDPDTGVPLEHLEGKLDFYERPEDRGGFKGFLRIRAPIGFAANRTEI